MKAENEKPSADSRKSEPSLSRRTFLRGSMASVAVSVPAAMAFTAAKEAAAAPAPAPAAAPAPKPATPPAKSLLVLRKNCTGCNSCVYACSLYHEGVVQPSMSRIHVRRVKGIVDVPMICWHCADAPCVEACPVTPKKAIYKDKESNVIKFHDEKLCLGIKCNKCVEACPPQYLRINVRTGLPLFCDLCGGDPQCVKACQRQARETGEVLRADPRGGGIHRSFRDVTPDDAVEGLIKSLYYPNTEGERR